MVLGLGRVNARPNLQNLLFHGILPDFNAVRRILPLFLGPRLFLILCTMFG